MLFNSYEFLFLFLPATLAGFFVLSERQHFKTAAAWLALVSIVFYGYWNPRYVVLLTSSILVNFAAGRQILRCVLGERLILARRILVFALVANLATLGYFKYANFFLNSINGVAHTNFHLSQIVLPIGVSFFTFTQIAFLVDTYFGKVRESNIIPYTLFVTFFPHLIAGPVLHHAEMMPQFARKATYEFRLDSFLIGLTFFSVGLFKKVILADGIQPFVGVVFDANSNYQVTAIEAWGGVLAYTFQLYFDFSGYSDMAIGLSKMINIDLPINFNSPYKAINISEFWRRWHMTLSRFLRDYLYIPLGGNRKGRFRRYANLFLTMLLGGLWHGAGWTFVVWGALHGTYLMIHQYWQSIRRRVHGNDPSRPSRASALVSMSITFLCVVVAWVFFRATSIDAALGVLRGMAGFNGLVLPVEWRVSLGLSTAAMTWLHFGHLEAFGGARQWAWICGLLAIVWLCPNSQTLIRRLNDGRLAAIHERWIWMSLGGLAVCVFMLAAINGSRGSSEFIYFNF